MELLLKNSPNHYDTNDVVFIAQDGHKWGSGELDETVFTIIKNVTLTDTEKELLLMQDEQMVIPKSALKVAALRRALINRDNMRSVKRRRYNYDNKIVRK